MNSAEWNTPADDRILWVDCLGGLVVGVLVILLHHQISEWENLPLWLVVSFGGANLLYGAFSMYTTTRRPRPKILVKILAIANMLWLLVCLATVATFWHQITLLGVLHILIEGVYVAGLGFTEWRWRHRLATYPSTSCGPDRVEVLSDLQKTLE